MVPLELAVVGDATIVGWYPSGTVNSTRTSDDSDEATDSEYVPSDATVVDPTSAPVLSKARTTTPGNAESPAVWPEPVAS